MNRMTFVVSLDVTDNARPQEVREAIHHALRDGLFLFAWASETRESKWGGRAHTFGYRDIGVLTTEGPKERAA